MLSLWYYRTVRKEANAVDAENCSRLQRWVPSARGVAVALAAPALSILVWECVRRACGQVSCDACGECADPNKSCWEVTTLRLKKALYIIMWLVWLGSALTLFGVAGVGHYCYGGFLGSAAVFCLAIVALSIAVLLAARRPKVQWDEERSVSLGLDGNLLLSPTNDSSDESDEIVNFNTTPAILGSVVQTESPLALIAPTND